MENIGYEPFQFGLCLPIKRLALKRCAPQKLELSLAASESFDLKRLSILNDGLLFVAHPMSGLGH